MNDSLREKDDLASAFRSVRDAYDGTSMESDLTLTRALVKTQSKRKRQRVAYWFVLPAAAMLFASTAFAGVTGRLAPAMHSVAEALHIESRDAREVPPPLQTPAPARTRSPSSVTPQQVIDSPAAAAPPDVEQNEAAAPTPSTTPPPTMALRTSTRHPAPAGSTASGPSGPAGPRLPSSSSAVTPTTTDNDPNAALFAEAHRLHFIDRDPARALKAWDRYLAAAPNGRFAPEARYNHAIAHLRLGHRDDAKRELEPFAKGTYGDYRRTDATSLLAALDHE